MMVWVWGGDLDWIGLDLGFRLVGWLGRGEECLTQGFLLGLGLDHFNFYMNGMGLLRWWHVGATLPTFDFSRY